MRIETALGQVRGFGVIISPQGHVLTAAHVIEKLEPDAIRGKLLPWKGSDLLPLRIIDKSEDKSVDIALLQIQNPPDNILPAQFASAPAMASSSQRLLTGSLGMLDTLVALDEKVTIAKDEVLEVRGSINSGVSGLPMFDRSGNLTGIVVAGVEGQTTAYVRPIGAVKEWLKNRNVGFNEAPSAPVMVGIYFSNASTSSRANFDTEREIIVPFSDAMSKDVNGSLTPEPQVFNDMMWRKIADAVFYNEAFSPDQRLNKVRQVLDPYYLGWLRTMDFSQLYLLIVRAEQTIDSYALKPALLIITQQGEKVDLEYVQDPKNKLKTYPPTDFNDKIETIPSIRSSLAVELLHSVVRKMPSMAHNNQVLADCIRFSGIDLSKNDWLYWAPDSLADQLRGTFKKNADEKQLKVKSASAKICREALSRQADRFSWPEHFNEFVVGVSIENSAIHWQTGHPWDEEEEHLAKGEIKQLASDPAGKDFSSIVEALASNIGQEWAQILKKLQGPPK